MTGETARRRRAGDSGPSGRRRRHLRGCLRWCRRRPHHRRRRADVIIGGLGKDTLTGGTGADTFGFFFALGATNVDRITDFSVPQDTFKLDNSVFTALGVSSKLAAKMFYKGAHAHDGDDHIIYNPATGALFYDSNGSAAAGEVKFATLAHHLAMTAADFLVA